jgi:hypothetical protein
MPFHTAEEILRDAAASIGQPWHQRIPEHAILHLQGEDISDLVRFTAQVFDASLSAGIILREAMNAERTCGQAWATGILSSAIHYINYGVPEGSASFNTMMFFHEDYPEWSAEAPKLDPIVVLNDAFHATASGWQEDSLINAVAHVRGEDISERTHYTHKFFDVPAGTQLGMLGRRDGPLSRREASIGDVVMVDCCTGDHQHMEGEDPDCECTTAECGCAYNPDDSGACSNCQQCDDCCSSNNACASCGKCGDVVSTDAYCSHCERCADCCKRKGECWTCSSCDRRYGTDDINCSNCECCERCCSCWYCEACEEHHSDSTRRCSGCDYCRASCTCDEDEDEDSSGPRIITLHSRDLQFHDSQKLQFKVNPLRRHISVEIEVDRATGGDTGPLQSAVDKWEDSVVEDGSLSGDAAHEVNTMPTNGDMFLVHIKDLTSAYAQVGAGCSDECGLHVHVDCRDMDVYDLRRVILLYAKVERALFELVDESRLNGSYSAVCGTEYANMSPTPSLFRRQILGTLYNDNVLVPKNGSKTIRTQKSDKWGARDRMRYRALNVHSFFLRKSLEFRHHEGSVDYSEITNWALVCGNVIDTAVRWSDAKINALPSDPFAALLVVIPASLHEYCFGKWEVTPLPANADGVSQMRFGKRSTDSWWDGMSVGKGSLPSVTEQKPTRPLTARVSAPVYGVAEYAAEVCGCGDPNCR